MSQSSRGGKVRKWLKVNKKDDGNGGLNSQGANGRLGSVSWNSDSLDVTQTSSNGNDSQNSDVRDKTTFNTDFVATQPSSSSQPGLNYSRAKKPGYIRREKFLTMPQSPSKKGKRRNGPK